jgi:hypothetical protein
MLVLPFIDDPATWALNVSVGAVRPCSVMALAEPLPSQTYSASKLPGTCSAKAVPLLPSCRNTT